MIHLDRINKTYGSRVVLSDVSLHLQPGCTYGLWGRNGVGKTTLLRIVTGMLRPDNGNVRVLGKDPASDWIVRRQMGIVEDGDTYFPELTAREYLWWVGRLRQAADSQCRSHVDQLTKAFSIDDRLDDLTGTLSHGMRRKVAIASAFVGRPPAVLLDEPTNGLDADSAAALCQLLVEHRRAGGMSLLACHDSQFIQSACSHVVAAQAGRVAEPAALAEAGGLPDWNVVSAAGSC